MPMQFDGTLNLLRSVQFDGTLNLLRSVFYLLVTLNYVCMYVCC